MKENWQEVLRLYFQRRLIAILLMGFASGLPLLLTGNTLAWFLSRAGIDKTSIGIFGAVAIPYAWKFIWSPSMDHFRLPFLHRWLGRRRSWLFFTQSCLVLSIFAMSQMDPVLQTGAVALLASCIAFFSASQDIVIDAYRIESLQEDEQGAGAGMTQAGYRLGALVAGAGAQALSDYWDWHWVYGLMAICMALSLPVTLWLREPEQAKPVRSPQGVSNEGRLKHIVIEPFLDFSKHRGWVLILLFVIFYKFGDAVGGAMANPFYNEMGFSGVEVAAISKVYGVVATIFGALLGGALVARIGLFSTLLLGGALQALTNLFFSGLALQGHDLYWLTYSITADNLAGGVASAAFVAYLSNLCAREFTATQYALLSSFAAQGRTIFSIPSGWLATQLGWFQFFAFTLLLALPGLVLLLWLWRIGSLRLEQQKEA